MRLYFIRHGENPANIDHIMSYKIVDFPLTPLGLQQANALAEWLSERQIAKVYSSPLLRALQTAQAIERRMALASVTVLEDLRELNVGVLDGSAELSDWEIHDDIIQRWNAGESALAFEQGEDHFSVQRRLRQAVKQIVSENATLGEREGVAVVAHGGVLVYGLPYICDNLSLVQARQGLKNTAVTVVETDGRRFSCLQWGLLDHLPPA